LRDGYRASRYLYNLTLISVTFAGFAALIAALRQMVGGRLTKHDAFLIRSALLRSLIVIICALLPPLLALFELPAATNMAIIKLHCGGFDWAFHIVLATHDKTSGNEQTNFENGPSILWRRIVDGDILADDRARNIAGTESRLFCGRYINFHDNQLDFRLAFARNCASPQFQVRER
jgi:hypothetical protein